MTYCQFPCSALKISELSNHVHITTLFSICVENEEEQVRNNVRWNLEVHKVLLLAKIQIAGIVELSEVLIVQCNFPSCSKMIRIVKYLVHPYLESKLKIVTRHNGNKWQVETWKFTRRVCCKCSPNRNNVARLCPLMPIEQNAN